VDRGVPDSFGGVPGDFAVHVHDRGGAVGGHVARLGAGILFLPVHTDDGCGNLLRSAEVAYGKGGESHRRRADERAWMGRTGHRLRGFVHRSVRCGGVVFGVGEEARVRAVCGVPDYLGLGGFILGVAIGRIADWGISFSLLRRCLQTRALKVFVVGGLPFGMIVLFGSSSRGDYASASPRRDTQPSPKAEEILCVF
jgi:hypothetical protein